MRSILLATLIAAIGLLPSTAAAATIQEIGGLQSATSGVTLGPDGNLWVSETVGNVVRLSPSGQVLNRYAVGTGKLSTGPGGRVWLADTAGDRFVWFDATAPEPSAHTVPTGFPCGPVAITEGPDGRMYFSLPVDGALCGDSRVGSMSADGTNLATQTFRGTVYDLAVANGKLFAPDADGDVVRRLAPGAALTVEAQIAVPAGSGATAVAAGAGSVAVALTSLGRVARFPADQSIGNAPVLTTPGSTLVSPAGIAAGPGGRFYVTGRGSGNLGRIAQDGTFSFSGTGGEPAAIVNGPDEDLYVTDRANARVLRFVSTAPRVTSVLGIPDGAMVMATVDPRGNDTTVVVDYGPTEAYGSTTPPVTVPAGVGGVNLTIALPGLGGVGNARVRATNAEGEVLSGNVGVSRMVPPPNPPFNPPPTVTTTFKWAFSGARTRITSVEVRELLGAETIKISCSGRGCPAKAKTYKRVKAGKRTISSPFGRKVKLAKGAKVTVTVTRGKATAAKAVLTVRGRKQKPKITQLPARL